MNKCESRAGLGSCLGRRNADLDWGYFWVMERALWGTLSLVTRAFPISPVHFKKQVIALLHCWKGGSWQSLNLQPDCYPLQDFWGIMAGWPSSIRVFRRLGEVTEETYLYFLWTMWYCWLHQSVTFIMHWSGLHPNEMHPLVWENEAASVTICQCSWQDGHPNAGLMRRNGNAKGRLKELFEWCWVEQLWVLATEPAKEGSQVRGWLWNKSTLVAEMNLDDRDGGSDRRPLKALSFGGWGSLQRPSGSTARDQRRCRRPSGGCYRPMIM